MSHQNSMNLKRVALCILSAFVVLSAPAAFASDNTTAFHQIFKHYETARQALIVDSMTDVPEKGRAIQGVLEGLASDWSAESAGVSPEAAPAIKKLLPEMTTAARGLASAAALDPARDAFYELSKLLVRWRKATDGERPAVAYCPMAKRSWLQPKGEIGNPYHGQSMPLCGQIVDG